MESKSSKPLRVLQVVDTLGMGGAETWLVSLQEYWSKTGRVHMDYLLTSGNKGVFDDRVAALGAQLFYCRYGRKQLPGFARNFRRILRDGQYDGLHDHQDYAAGWHFLIGLGRLPRIAVSHVHNPTTHITENYNVSWLRRLNTQIGQRLVKRLATSVCGTSAEILRGYGFQPGQSRRPEVAVAHCGFEVNRFNGERDIDRARTLNEFNWPADAKIVLFAGRLDRTLEFHSPQNHKNSWLAINIARLAAEKDPRVHLIMAGAGDEMRQTLESQVNAWDLSERFKLVGVRHDLPQLMRSAEVLLFPSREEGLGMVAVEAQAAGLPVLVSTGVPKECMVIAELCEFMTFDQPIEQWADALLRLASSPRLSVEHCRRAVQASAFSIENSAARLEALYSGQSLTGSHS